MVKLKTLRYLFGVVLTGAIFVVASGQGARALTVDTTVSPLEGNGTQREPQLTFLSDNGVDTLTAIAFGLEYDQGDPPVTVGTFGTFSPLPTPSLNLISPNRNMNYSPSKYLGLDGEQAQNFIGYGEVVQMQFSQSLNQNSLADFRAM